MNLWDRVKETYHRACELQIAGELAAADQLIRNEVLPRFTEWSLASGCDADHRRLFIENLSRQEKRRVESAWVQHHLEARTRRGELEKSLIRERTNLQREWAAQASVSQTFAEAAIAVTQEPVAAPPELEPLDQPVAPIAPPPSSQPLAQTSSGPERIPIDDVANVIDFVLRQHQAEAARSDRAEEAVV